MKTQTGDQPTASSYFTKGSVCSSLGVQSVPSQWSETSPPSAPYAISMVVPGTELGLASWAKLCWHLTSLLFP